jgi:hypothetical protein
MSVVLVLSVLLCVGPAQAAFQFEITPSVGARLQLKFANYELVVTPAGEGALPSGAGDELRGIFEITTIRDANTATQYWSKTATQHLVGYFEDYIARSAPPPGGGDVQFDGGVFRMWFDDGSGTPFDPTFATVSGPVGHGAGYFGAPGAEWLVAVGVGGIVPGDLTVELNSTVTAATSPFTGTGAGYLDAIGGTHAFIFGADAFDVAGPDGLNQDLFLQSTIRAPGAAGWPADSQDPVEGIYVIPEPAGLAVWSLLVVGVGLLMRSRSRR